MMNPLQKSIILALETELPPLDVRLYKPLIRDLTNRLLNRFNEHKSPNGDMDVRYYRSQLLFLLVNEILENRTQIRTRQGLRSVFDQRFASANTEGEKKALILQFAADLGASPARIRGDRRAFKRWFGYDTVLERHTREISRIEYRLVFLLNRLGCITAGNLTLSGEPTKQLQILTQININETLKPLLVHGGDERIRIETFRCMAAILRATSPTVKIQAMDADITTFIYRACLDTRQPIRIQCEAFDLLSVLDPTHFFQAASRRLLTPGRDDDLFVRRKTVQLLEYHIDQEREINRLIPPISSDSSPFVRQALPNVLIAHQLHRPQSTDCHSLTQGLHRILLKDTAHQVRGAALMAIASSDDFILAYPDRVSDLIFSHLTAETHPFVLRLGLEKLPDMYECLRKNGEQDTAHAFLLRLSPIVAAHHQQAEHLPVRRWAAQCRERLFVRSDESARHLLKNLQHLIPSIRPGTGKRIPQAWMDQADETTIGRVLSVLAREDYGIAFKTGIFGPYLFRGDRFGFRLWRLIHEFFSPSPEKRQGFSHVIGRCFHLPLRAPSAICSELTQTSVPGEPLYNETENGWRPYLPLVDEAVSGAGQLTGPSPVLVFTAEGITTIIPPSGMFRRWTAFLTLTFRFSRFAELRNWQEESSSPPNNYIQALRETGFFITFKGHMDPNGNTDEDPAVCRFFSIGIPILSLDLWEGLKRYFFSAYENSLYELGLFGAGLMLIFLYRHISRSIQVHRARKQITLVIGGWGTRGKSGVERLKASIMEALGHGFVNKTTGCEAMFLHAVPFGKTREMFLFRPYDKATIWEHHNLICLTRDLGARIFLWECMALTPAFVSILQQHWTRDDYSTITNTYPDHEDIQGPAGINIPQVMTHFIPKKSVLITSEEEMKPVLAHAAAEKKTSITYSGWMEAGLLTPDVLSRFPYEEHPNNVALVLKLAETLHIDPDFAIREMADRVVPDIGALKVFPAARVDGRDLIFINGMSANERFATLSNWQRMGFDTHDYEKESGTITSTLVNNRADRIPRSRMFAGIIAEDLEADYHFLIGTNLTGLMGYIHSAWNHFIDGYPLFSGADTDSAFATKTFHKMARQLRIPLNRSTIACRINAMLTGIGCDPLEEKEITEVLETPSCITRLKTTAEADAPSDNALHSLMVPFIKQWTGYLDQIRDFEKQLVSGAPPAVLEKTFKALCTKWFMDKFILMENPHITGNQIIHTICTHTPPGLLNKIMGLQNIKGPGLDYVYRWQAWEACRMSGEKLLNERDPDQFEQGFVELTSFQDYGLLCEAYMTELISTAEQMMIAQTERYQAGLALIRSNLQKALDSIRPTLKHGTSHHTLLSKIAAAVEAFLDIGDAVKRRRMANQIYTDLVDERISHERAAIELKRLNQRQKGGWFGG